MNHDKKPSLHRRIGPIPELQRKYGLIILGVSHYTAPPDSFQECTERIFEFYSLSHLLRGRGRCILDDGTDVIMEEGDAVLVPPGMVNRYGGWAGHPYEEEALRFFGPIADGMFSAGVIRNGVFPLGPDQLLLPKKRLFSDPSADAQVHAVLELQRLLVQISDLRHLPPLGENPVARILEHVRNSPERWWTVEEMAALCNLTVPRFRRHFHALTGANPKEYCEQLKLRRAAEMLASDRSGLRRIALSLGYADEYHFARRFKLFFGISPGQYRLHL